MRPRRPSAVITHGRLIHGGRCRTCCACPHSRSASQSFRSSLWKPTIRRFMFDIPVDDRYAYDVAVVSGFALGYFLPHPDKEPATSVAARLAVYRSASGHNRRREQGEPLLRSRVTVDPYAARRAKTQAIEGLSLRCCDLDKGVIGGLRHGNSARAESRADAALRSASRDASTSAPVSENTYAPIIAPGAV
jgi:hypothetical protein